MNSPSQNRRSSLNQTKTPEEEKKIKLSTDDTNQDENDVFHYLKANLTN